MGMHGVNRARLLPVLAAAVTLLLYPARVPAVDQPAGLGELSLEELMKIKVQTVYGASKFEQQVSEAPASISIITADDIAKYGYRTFADVLRSVRGFHVTNDRNYSFVGIRGFLRPGDYNSRVLVVIDGHRMNENVYDSVNLGTEFEVDLEQIERIEIIRGPGSSLYGANAFFAVINVLTKKGRDLRGADIAAAGGSLETYRGRISYGKEYRNGLDVALSGSVYDSGGHERLYYKEFDDPATNTGIAEHSDDDRYGHVFSRFSLQDLTLEGVFMEREKGIPTGAFGTVFNDQRNRTVDRHFYLDLKYDHAVTAQAGVLAHLYYDAYSYDGTSVYDLADPGAASLLVLNKDQGRGRWWGADLQYTATVLRKNKLIAGAGYQDNTRQSLSNHDVDPFLSYLDDTRNSAIVSLFLQDESRIADKVILNAGLRWDHYESFGSTVNPRVALLYKPFPKSIVKLLYSEAFRAPNTYEMFYVATGYKPNPDLEPEKIKSWELVYELTFGDHVRSSVSGFSNTIDGLISQQVDPADGLLQFQNHDEVEARGVELELDGTWQNGVQARANYTFQRTEDRNTGEVLTNSPHHLAKCNVTAPLLRSKVFAGFEVQYTSGRKTLAGNEAPGYLLANLTLLGKRLLPGLDVSASVANLFDERYGDPVAADFRQDVIEQDGRTFRAEATYHF
jgi:iron complex outermembrane receptor protein